MKRIIAAAALVTLAACDSGGVVDQTVRSGVRQSAVQACVAWIPQSDIAQAAGLAPERLCDCAADRLTRDRSASELADLRPGREEIRAAVAQCVGDLRKGA